MEVLAQQKINVQACFFVLTGSVQVAEQPGDTNADTLLCILASSIMSNGNNNWMC